MDISASSNSSNTGGGYSGNFTDNSTLHSATPRFSSQLDEDEIVISGISGRFPESADMNEFMDNLLHGVNMVTVNERRFKPGLYGIPHGFGTLKEIDKFDAEAFRMLPNQVKKTDPQLRMMLETTYEAMCDAGVNPADERGSKTGVFLGLCMTESLTLLSSEPNRIDGLALIGCSNSMFANRISYTFDFKGPSCAYDTACSTSAFALEAAVSAMRAGKCDAAIVTASTLILTPTGSVQFDRLGMLSKDGACKSFDKSGDGFARAETVATIYLQRASAAKRAYASIVHIKTNTDGYKDNGITYPSAGMQEELLRSVYREAYARAGIDKGEVTYVEAHGTGTAAGDPQELAAISKIFRPRGVGAATPLLVGSVKSNMGHSEGASGLCSIAKVVVMLQSGLIPANLHYNEPSYGLNSIRSGAIKVVDKNTDWTGGLIAVNSFGFGGVNVHLVLKPHEHVSKKVLTNLESSSSAPAIQSARLVIFSGRDDAGVSNALKKIIEAQDPNLVLLANELCKTPNPVSTVRGFAICQTPGLTTDGPNDAAPAILHVEPRSSNTPPLWFVFNGIGSQWFGMCHDLLVLDTFAKSIHASAKTLQDKFNFDLLTLLKATDPDPQIYEQPINCFVGITACQIALVDVLRSLGLRPTGFLGHSAGEMACAYLDECLTAEETIICAYLRGESLANTNTETEPGAMAVVSLSLPQVEKLCPPGVYPACHNGIDSITVSGTRSLVRDFVQLLKDKKKGVTEVKSCGLAFHSPYIAKASRQFLSALRAEFNRPSLARSSNWISTSIPESEWNSALHATASPEYFVNNFLSPVLFYEGLQHVPENAVVLEVGPSGLLRGLIKKACPTCTVIPLQVRDSKQGHIDLLTALGKLYLAGVDFDANKLVEASEIRFPVPLGTPFLSPLVAGAWNYSTSWEVPYFGMNGELQITRFEIDMASEADSFLSGHVVQGRILFPATGYLVLVWKHYALTRQLQYEECPVVFENVRFNRVTVLGRRDKVEFRVHISELSGAFEVKEGGAIVASGTVRSPDSNPALFETQIDESEFHTIEKEQMGKLCGETSTEDNLAYLNNNHIYKRFRFYGFEYSGLFRGIKLCDPDFQYFLMDWRNNWIAFLDTFLQTCIKPFEPSLKVRLPTAIGKIVLDPARLLEYVTNNQSKVNGNVVTPGVDVFLYKDQPMGLVKCHGVEMHDLKLTTVNRKVKDVQPELFTYHFTPYFDNPSVVDASPDGGDSSPLLECVCIVMENLTNRFMESSFKMTLIEATHTEPDLQESVAVDNLIRMSYGVLEMTYTIFAQHETESDGQHQHAPPPPANIDLRHFDEFHTEGWLDRTYDIIILHNHAFLAAIACEYLKKGKFLILKLKRSDEITKEELLAKMGPKLGIVAVKYSKTHVVYLIRKNTKPSTEPLVVISVSSRHMEWVPLLRDAIRDQEARANATITVMEQDIAKTKATPKTKTKPPRVFLVSNGAEEHDSGIQGLINCLRKEKYSQHCRMIFSKSHELDLNFSDPSPELQKVLKNDLVVNVFDEESRWGFYSSCTRLNYKSATRKVANAFIGMDNIGDLTTFRWIEGADLKKLVPNSNEQPKKFTPVDVHFAALNFKDIMLATGSLPSPDATGATPYTIESPLGLEFSGLTADGRRVCGYNEGQSIATDVLGCEQQIWEVPTGWSLAQAATVPVVYATAYLALVDRARIQDGESILIHSGAGGVGQAAIRIALSKNCVVFTTAGSPDKKEFLRKQFPQISESHIGNSRDTSFERMILRQTKGRGVDIVLNSLSGEKLEASVRCLARHGRFLEIGKFDLVANKALGMELFLKDASFHGVMLDSLWDARDQALGQRLKNLVQEGIESGVVQPLPSRVFQMEQVEPAFRYMGTGKHVGKVLIQVRKDEQEFSDSLLLEASPRIYFAPSKSYIVVGGLGGIGLEFINWMIGRNARQIVVSSRSGVKTAYQSEYIRAWKQRGVRIDVVPYDASQMEDAETLLAHAAKLDPVDGFFNLAMRLEMSFMKEQTELQFWAAMNPKTVLTRNMDQLTRARCPSMSHFVVFSSVVAGIGMPGQCNYGMANSGVEQICERRYNEGFAGKAIQLGPISEAGFFQEMCQNHTHKAEQLKSYGGSGVQTISSLLKCLDVLLSAPDPFVVSRVNRELEAGSKPGMSAGDTFADRLGHVLGTDITKLNPKTKLTELGLDSIVAMEVRQVLEQDFGLNLSATEVRTITLEQILEMSKNSEKNVMTPSSSRMSARRRAATADLFQFNFMRNAKKAKILYKQCVHPLNKLTDKSQGTIFICNSVEGPHILRILGGLMKKPAFTMQFPEDAPLDSLDAFVNYYLEQLKATEPDGPYVLAGYSAGALVAIELALRLQAAGDEVLKVVLIDMSPGRAEAILEENLGADRTHIEEMDVLIVVLSQVLNIDRAQVELIMASLPDRDSRLEKAVELGSALFDEDVDFKMLDRLLGENQMKIINFFNRYKPSSMYHGKIALVRTTQNLISYDSTEYWGLEEFCTQIPVVHTIESTHSYLIAEPGVYQLAAVIND